MTPAASARTRWCLLVVSCVLVVLASSVVWRTRSPAAAEALALLPAVAAVVWTNHRTATESAASQARVEHQTARIEQCGAAQARFVHSTFHEIRMPLAIALSHAERWRAEVLASPGAVAPAGTPPLARPASAPTGSCRTRPDAP